MALLGALDPAVMAHASLNGLAVLYISARRLLEGAEDPLTELALRTIAVERAAHVGWALEGLQPPLSEVAARRATAVVLAGCAIRQWHSLALEERDRVLRDIVDGAPAVAADLRDIVGGLGEVDLRA
jgi:hypothetical protein